MLEVERGADGGRAIHEVVALDNVSRKPAEKEQRFVGFDVARIDRDDQMPRIKQRRAVLIDHLHQRKQYRSAMLEFGVDRQCRNFGNVATAGANAAQVEYTLQRETDGALADQRQGADHLAVELGAQYGGRRQGMVDRDPHAGRVALHVAALDVDVVQQAEAGFQLFPGFGDLE